VKHKKRIYEGNPGGLLFFMILNVNEDGGRQASKWP